MKWKDTKSKLVQVSTPPFDHLDEVTVAAIIATGGVIYLFE